MCTSFLNSELLGMPRTFFLLYHPRNFMAEAMQNPRRLSFLSILKPEAIEGSFQNRQSGHDTIIKLVDIRFSLHTRFTYSHF